jgi:hypothetical protein
MTHSPHHRLALCAALALVASACDSDSSHLLDPTPTRGAIVTFAFEGHPADTIRVPVEDTTAIRLAEDYVRTKTGPKMLIGKISRGSGLDARFPFRFDPATVDVVDMAMEVCDGAPMKTSAALDDFFEWSTGSRTSTTTTWCPWSSYPVKVERVGA